MPRYSKRSSVDIVKLDLPGLVMDAIQIQSKEALQKCTALAFKSILKNSVKAQQAFIRSQYEMAATDSTVIAAIEVADSLGFVELAKEMEADFSTKTGRALL